MDVERTIEFILKCQARAELRAEKADARMDRADARMDKFDKRLEGIAKLIRQGMVMLSRTHQEMAGMRRELRQELKELHAAQRATDLKLDRLATAHEATERSLKAFIDSMRSGRNGGGRHQS